MYPAMMRTAGFTLLLSIGLVSTAVAADRHTDHRECRERCPAQRFSGGRWGSGPAQRAEFVWDDFHIAGGDDHDHFDRFDDGYNRHRRQQQYRLGCLGQTGGGGGGGASRGGGGGSTSTAGAATATGSAGNGNFVLCPPSGAPGLEPLFIGTDLSCAPQ